MPGRTWSAADREEYEAACTEAWAAGTSTRERGEAFRALVADAVQAHRSWACHLMRIFAERGAQAELKSWRKASQPVAVVAYNGQVLSRPRVVGFQQRDAEGHGYVVQELFDLIPFAKIEEKVTEYQRQVGAYRENLALARRLLELRDAVPDALTPADAASRLGTTVDAWLMQEAS